MRGCMIFYVNSIHLALSQKTEYHRVEFAEPNIHPLVSSLSPR